MKRMEFENEAQEDDAKRLLGNHATWKFSLSQQPLGKISENRSLFNKTIAKTMEILWDLSALKKYKFSLSRNLLR